MTPLLLDQGLPVGAARALRERGWDVVHVSERGWSWAPDEALLAHAAAEGRTVVTLDADFPMLVALEQRRRPSVIHLRGQHIDVAACVERLTELVPGLAADLRAGCVVSVRDALVRVRRLPVRRG